MDRRGQSVVGGYSGGGHNLTPDINRIRLVNRTTCLFVKIDWRGGDSNRLSYITILPKSSLMHYIPRLQPAAIHR